MNAIKRLSSVFVHVVVALSLLVTSVGVLAQSKSGVRPQAISLPSGPGSMDGLGESFEPGEAHSDAPLKPENAGMTRRKGPLRQLEAAREHGVAFFGLAGVREELAETTHREEGVRVSGADVLLVNAHDVSVEADRVVGLAALRLCPREQRDRSQ